MDKDRYYVDRCGGGGSMPGALLDEMIEYVDRFERRVSLQALEALKRIAELLSQSLRDRHPPEG